MKIGNLLRLQLKVGHASKMFRIFLFTVMSQLQDLDQGSGVLGPNKSFHLEKVIFDKGGERAFAVRSLKLALWDQDWGIYEIRT